MDPIVIIGTGLAGYTVAREFRKRDTETPLHIITADDGVSYSKPMLSNGLDKGKTPGDLAMANAEKMAKDLNATIWTHIRVSAILPNQHQVATERGEITYHKLVLALGADPIRLPIDGNAANEVISVNDLEDYRRFRAKIDGARSIAIIGAGLIGCEFANDLKRAGFDVEVIDPAPVPLSRLLPKQAAQSVQDALASIGVQWHLGVAVVSVDKAASGYHLGLSHGGPLQADVVLSAVGLQPRTALAETQGLKVERGIVVDQTLQTSTKDVYAVGDCAEVEGLVLPYVMPLMNSARVLAATLAGTPTKVFYAAMPVFVKTPAIPVIVCPSVRNVEGEWQEQVFGNGILSQFFDQEKNLQAFALTGDAVSEKGRLVKQIQPWLP